MPPQVKLRFILATDKLKRFLVKGNCGYDGATYKVDINSGKRSFIYAFSEYQNNSIEIKDNQENYFE